MSVPLKHRGTPERIATFMSLVPSPIFSFSFSSSQCLTGSLSLSLSSSSPRRRRRRLPAPPHPANRIGSSDDSSAVAAGRFVPSETESCSRAPVPVLQSVDDVAASMTCPRLPVLSDSDNLDSDACRRLEPDNSTDMHKQSPMCWSIRPRALCTRISGRKCRHSSCQSVVDVESVPVPVPQQTTVDVFDVLHRDQRTVCVTSPFLKVSRCNRTCECAQFSDAVTSVNNDYECKFSAGATRSCNVLARFSMQRFCSAVLCGLLLLTALRPHSSMAAPVPQSSTSSSDGNKTAWKNPCGGTVSKDVSNGSDIPETNATAVLERVKMQSRLTLQASDKLRTNYCQDQFFGDICTESFNFNNEDFKFPVIPKNLNEKLERDHFDDKNVDGLLQEAYSNIQIYAAALHKLSNDSDKRRMRNPIYSDYKILRDKVTQLQCELQVLLKLRNIEQPPDIDDREVEKLNLDQKYNDDVSTTTIRDWAILKEAMNGLEYFDQLLDHALTFQQSHL